MIQYEYECEKHGVFTTGTRGEKVPCKEKGCKKWAKRKYSAFGIAVK